MLDLNNIIFSLTRRIAHGNKTCNFLLQELRKKREVLRTTEESENNAFSNLQENRKAEKKEIVKRAAKNQSLESHLVANDYQTKVTLEEVTKRRKIPLF